VRQRTPPCRQQTAFGRAPQNRRRPTTAAEKALEFIRDETTVGLGTGRAATAFVTALGARVKAGLRVRGVPTSQATAQLAAQLGIPLTTLDAVERLDLTVDGADEVDPRLDLIKGWGGALVREKIVAASSDRLLIVVGDEKLVPVLGARGKLPVEVVPFGQALCARREIGCLPTPRAAGGQLFVTDNGNHILDCAVQAIADPAALDAQILAIPGVVGSGLFIGMAHMVIIERADGVAVRERR
jgi:ribose 5-phosphate isomerase A